MFSRSQIVLRGSFPRCWESGILLSGRILLTPGKPNPLYFVRVLWRIVSAQFVVGVPRSWASSAALVWENAV